MNALRHLSRRSIRTINKPRQRMIAVQHRFIHHRSIHHRLSSPYLKASSGFQVSSKRGFSNMHGTHFSWFEWWSRLFFSHWHETKWASSVITVSGGFVCIVCGWCITNSVMRDPEVRLRPHKKAWHVSQSRLNNAGLYKGG